MPNALDRDNFSLEELAICLSHYDLGAISSVEEFSRGSRKAPKLIIESKRGKFLFKRRAVGRNDLERVSFAHHIQLHLGRQNFPLPHLIVTKRDKKSMLVLDSNIYEMFEFIEGSSYDNSKDATHSSGKTLALCHKLLEDFQSEFTPPIGSYHNARAIHQAIRNTVSSLPMEARPPKDVLTSTVHSIEKSYKHSAKKTEELGLMDWGVQFVHGDWHPGNMLFKKHKVVAVIDYDATRLQQRVIDLANGALQFSIIGGSENPADWPENVDLARFKRFMRGYDEVNVISTAEIKSIPYLMCEAMIAEAVLPIAATGTFGRLQGFPFLQMVERKVNWILEHAEELQSFM